MATDITPRLDKYQELAATYGRDCEIISVPCPGLAGRIERGDLAAADLREMIRGYVGSFAGTVGSVVLGCTHYPFVRTQIAEVLGGDVHFYDGRCRDGPASCAIAWGSAAFWPTRPTRAP